MTTPKKVIELTKREYDIFCFMCTKKETTLGGKPRVNLPPSAIRDHFKEEYPGIDTHVVGRCQERLERVRLLIPIRNPDDSVRTKKPVLKFEINERLHKNSEIRIIKKRQSGFAKGTRKKESKIGLDFLADREKELKSIAGDIVRLRKELDLKIATERRLKLEAVVLMVLIRSLLFTGASKLKR